MRPKHNNGKEMNKMEAKITITGTEKALNVWTMAKATVEGKEYKVQMVRFEEPSIYGISKGRISKLWVRGEDGTVVISYDRGWDIRPTTAEGKALLATITKQYNRERERT